MSTELPIRIGPYQVLSVLGRGSLGTAYKASAPGGRAVVVKVPAPRLVETPEAVELYEREIAEAASLSHPNLVAVLDRGRDGGMPYVATEYVEGGLLWDVLRQRRLSLQEALGVFRAVCRGLQHAHQKGIVHRDLNPRNVFVSPDLATVKVADFGLRRAESAARLAGTLATGEITLGTLYYLAPEQAESPGSADHRADVYSAGVVLHEMLTGRSPSGKFALPSQLNSELPSDLDVFVLKCLARRPDDRYGSMSEVLSELDRLEESLRLRLLAELRGLSRQTSRLLGKSPAADAGKPRPLLLWGGLALLAVVLAVVVFLLARG